MISRIKPSKSEEKKLREVADSLTGKIAREVERVDRRIKVVLLGSASRNTWLKNEKDLDIFVMFPIEYERGQLEGVVTRVGKKILKNLEKRYAEHPYVKGFYEGFEVEIVPCYAVESPEKMKSAVDRTPFHDEFIKKNIAGKEDEVRLLKQFLKGTRCYGAEAKVEGFSGYLCELLVIKYGSFEGVLKGSEKWKTGEVFWVAGSPSVAEMRKKFSSPLIFIDPIDSNRNVASALSGQKFSEFTYAAKEYLNKPNEKFFFPRQRKANGSRVVGKFKERGTEVVAIVLEKPNVVEDVLYPQMRKAFTWLKNVLEENDFPLVGMDFFVRDRICFLIELRALEIPRVRLHIGPPVNSDHEIRFLEKYKTYKGKLTEPFIMGNRWGIFLRRKHTNAKDLLEEFLSRKELEREGMPRHIAESLHKGFEIKVNKGAIINEFLSDLQEYFDPVPPWKA